MDGKPLTSEVFNTAAMRYHGVAGLLPPH